MKYIIQEPDFVVSTSHYYNMIYTTCFYLTQEAKVYTATTAVTSIFADDIVPMLIQKVNGKSKYTCNLIIIYEAMESITAVITASILADDTMPM